MRKSLLTLSLAALVGVGAVTVNSFAEEAKPDAGSKAAATATAQVGQPAPGFSLSDQDGKTLALDQFKGKVVVLEWFNEECPYVKKFYSQGHMNKWAAAYRDKGVVWLTIDSTSFHDVSHAKKVAGELKIDRPLLSDASGQVGKLYGATNTPHMYVIDPNGTLVYAGAIDDKRSSETSDIDGATNYVAKALDEILAGKSVSTAQTKAYGCSIKYAK